MIDRPDHLKGQLILGIDLGTTKSGVAVWNEALGKVTMLSDEDGHSVIPSVVGWDPDARRWLVGHAARALAVSHPAHVAYSTKRYIGRSFGDPSVRRGREDLAYGLVRGDAARPHDILVELGTDDGAPQRLSPPEVAAMVLRTLRETAAHALRLPLDAVRYAVVTVPAYFNMLQRKATIEAGELAGLTVVDILNEPTAAALAYGADILDPTERRILVFDLGGGTFDVSLLEAWRDDDAYGFFTRVVDGDTRLGGDDVDASIVRWLADEIERRHGRAVRASDRVARARLRVAAESAKAALSAPAVEAQPIDIRGLDLGGGPPIDVHVDLTQAQLEQLAGDVVRRTQAIVSRAVEEVAGLRWDQLHEIVLVGGQALMPAIRRGVEALAGRAPRVDERARLAVALGAGEYARVLSLGHERFHQNSVTNVLALPVGIRLHDDSFRVVVPANVVVPHVSEPFAVSTTEDNQPLIRVEVLQGPRGAATAEECIVLDSLVMEVPPAPAGLPKIDVVFDVQTDGTMKITVTDTRRHRRAEKDIRDTQLTWLDERTAVAGSP